MPNKAHHIHDKFIKASFSDPKRAVAFFEQFLPAHLVDTLNLSTLKVLQESYLQLDLSEHFSDIVFELRTKSDDPIDVVLLFEHKSSPDKNVLIQVGHYMFSHWFRCANESRPLKIIIPVIYYQGSRKWEQPILSQLFPTVEGELSDYIPFIKNIFIAIRTLSDESISQMKNGMMAAAVLVQKKGTTPIRMIEDLIKIFELFPATAHEGNFLEQVFVYIISVADVPQSDLKKALDLIPENIKDNIMNTYSRIK